MDVRSTIIVGSGPAAYNCAVYLKEWRPLLIEGGYVGNNGPGGQLTTTTMVDNYPGFPGGVGGLDLVDLMARHASAETVSDTACSLERLPCGIFQVATESSGVFHARCVVVATGSAARRLYVPGTGDNEFWMRGISACAVCDGWAFRDKACCVIGGGDSAVEEARYMAGLARIVYLVHRRDKFRARADMLEKLQRLENVVIVRSQVLVRAEGKDRLQRLVFESTKGEDGVVLDVEGLFFGIGHDPNTSFLGGCVELDKDGYVVTNARMETSMEGVFACGDVQDKKYRQANTAAASGCMAALSAIAYLVKTGEDAAAPASPRDESFQCE